MAEIGWKSVGNRLAVVGCWLLVVSCSVHRQVAEVRDEVSAVESVAKVERRGVSLDSVLTSLALRFDTLELELERPCVAAEGGVERVRVRVTGGSVESSHERVTEVVDDEVVCDSVAAVSAVSEQRDEEGERVGVAKPPSRKTWAWLIAVCGIAFVAIWWLRTRK